MLSRTPVRISIIAVLFLAALFVNLPKRINGIAIPGPEFPLKFGLDLVGGSHMVFEADTSKIDSSQKADAIASLREVVERRVNFFGVAETNVLTSTFEDTTRIIVELPGVTETSTAVGFLESQAQLVFAEVDHQASDSGTLKPTSLTGAMLKRASVVPDPNTAKPTISLEFSKEGAELFAAITEANIGKPLAIVLDNEIISAPLVNEKITGGSAVITGVFTNEEAKTLASQLNAGALPVPIKLVEERTVGATLGTESVQKSIQAGLVGLGVVALFMIIIYGKFGLVADIGLIIFAVLTLALYRLFGIVLTLPGIAGFLLSIGMAVDANILIFERFREEKKVRHNILDALEISFGRAWDSIRDANIATLITVFVLANPFNWSFLHTSGPVRGFAMTLFLGIVLSLFTGIFVSRNLLRLIVRGDKK